ncbi:MAG: DUF2310 family Zn-ribbon-containing protein, partial [Planctomycetota bacterium]
MYIRGSKCRTKVAHFSEGAQVLFAEIQETLAGKTEDLPDFGHFSSVICGECLCPIPPYKIPDDIGVTSWEIVYENIDLIWLNCGVLESWAESQLQDYKSDLNREARRIIGRLHKFRPVPAYYQIQAEEYSLDMPCP